MECEVTHERGICRGLPLRDHMESQIYGPKEFTYIEIEVSKHQNKATFENRHAHDACFPDFDLFLSCF